MEGRSMSCSFCNRLENTEEEAKEAIEKYGKFFPRGVIMQAIGIVTEYNPFHKGHLYHLRKVKENIRRPLSLP